jgi:hypothetical protein
MPGTRCATRAGIPKHLGKRQLWIDQVLKGPIGPGAVEGGSAEGQGLGHTDDRCGAAPTRLGRHGQRAVGHHDLSPSFGQNDKRLGSATNSSTDVQISAITVRCDHLK